MNDRLTNRLNMVGACVAVAESSAFRPVWDGQAPAAFGVELSSLKTNLASVSALATQSGSATTGAAEAKDVAETELENAAYPLARALALHFKKTGNLTHRAKVNVSLSAIQRLRTQALVALTKEIRDLANATKAEPGAADRGLTDPRIATLTAAIAVYEPLIAAPRTQIVNRSTLLRELETRTAELLDALSDLDDLIAQFHTTDLSRRFQSAWQQARTILDAGHGPAAIPTPPPPQPTPPTP